MVQRAYVDTNVFIDFFEERDSAAYRFFVKSLQCKYTIIISQITIKEVVRYSGSSFENLVSMLKDARKIKIAEVLEEDENHAKTLVRKGLTHFSDAAHIAIAERVGADLIVTKNIKDFVTATKLPVQRPNTL